MKRKRISLKLTFGIVVSLVLLTVGISFATERIYRKNMEEKYSDIAFNQASLAAYYIDGDTIANYLETGVKDDYYEEVRLYLLNAKKISDLKYFYVVLPTQDEQIYVWDAGDAGEEGVCDLLDTDIYYDDGKDIMLAAMDPEGEKQILITQSDDYGYIASAYVPILDSTGKSVALASVDISMDVINEEITNVVKTIIMIAVLILALMVLISFFYFKTLILKPIDILENSTKNLVSDDLNSLNEFNIDLHTNDEFEDLADSFKSMSNSLKKYIENLSKVTAEKERIGAELNVATKIQASMLPCIFPPFPNRDEFEIFASMNPAKEVGGDFYDFFMVDDKHLAFVVADVSGKGIPAALFMVIGKTLIKDHTTPDTDLGDVFSEVNNLLCEGNSEELFITAFEGVLNLETGELRYANAGHEMPFIMPPNGDFEFKKIPSAFVLAGMEDMKYKSGSMMLEEGTKIFEYTDGVTEATNAQNELFGMDRLGESLNRSKSESTSMICANLKSDIDSFVKDAPQFDDITMLCVEFKKKMSC